MQAAIIIPARLESTRFPRKVIAPLAGVPLIVRVCRQASLVTSNILVATDSQQVVDIVEEAGFSAVCTEGEYSSGSDRIAAVARTRTEDIIVNWQGDEPLLDPSIVEAAIALVREGADIGTCMTDFESWQEYLNPNRVKALANAEHRALYFSRAAIPHGLTEADLPNALYVGLHLGIYAYRREVLLDLASRKPCALERVERLEQLRALHYNFQIGIRRVQCDSFGIDTPTDLEKAEAYLAQKGSLHGKT